VPERPPAPVTVPISPAITKPSFNKSLRYPENDNEVVFKANPVPDFSRVFEPAHEHHHTEVQPFECMAKYGDVYKRREQMREEAEKELAQQREFTAHPMPDYSKMELPSAAPTALTVIEPFNLKGEVIHEQYQENWSEKLKQMQAAQKAMTEFHATKLPENNGPFIPRKLHKAATKV
jgi:hypothetical protein